MTTTSDNPVGVHWNLGFTGRTWGSWIVLKMHMECRHATHQQMGRRLKFHQTPGLVQASQGGAGCGAPGGSLVLVNRELRQPQVTLEAGHKRATFPGVPQPVLTYEMLTCHHPLSESGGRALGSHGQSWPYRGHRGVEGKGHSQSRLSLKYPCPQRYGCNRYGVFMPV
jgi:hypothetical protein